MTDPASIRFGTDGVRGAAGEWPITPAGARAIGKAVAIWAHQGGAVPQVLVARDPRESGPALEEAVVAGIIDGGARALVGGVMPTAAASCAIAAHGLAAGVVLTASHNPWSDNGLKVLVAGGSKLLRPAALEAVFGAARPPGLSAGSAGPLPDPLAPWRAAMPDLDLTGVTVLLDAASGAGYHAAVPVLEARGARVIRRDPAPTGHNINAGTGAMHPPTAAEVAATGADLCVCLDGDADRVVLVDPTSGVLDGDDLLWLLSQGSEGPLVGTIMSNGGLEAALGGRLVRAPVGDRYVAERMAESSARFGAEPSGHVLFADGMPTGDGLYSALRAMAAVAHGERARLPLPVGGWTRWPQVHHAVRFTGPRVPLDGLQTLDAVRRSGQRAVVRYSGTEPKLRIMVEGMGSGAQSPRSLVDEIAREFSALLDGRVGAG